MLIRFLVTSKSYNRQLFWDFMENGLDFFQTAFGCRKGWRLGERNGCFFGIFQYTVDKKAMHLFCLLYFLLCLQENISKIIAWSNLIIFLQSSSVLRLFLLIFCTQFCSDFGALKQKWCHRNLSIPIHRNLTTQSVWTVILWQILIGLPIFSQVN